MANPNSPSIETLAVDFTDLPLREAYKLMIGAIVPRPIAFVSTVNSKGVGNLAPFSFFNGICSDPPIVMISITRKPDGSKKDTLINIEETGQFIINMASESIVEQVNQCSADYPYGVDEMQKVGLTPLPSIRVKASRVAESPLHIECELFKTVEIGEPKVGSATVVFGKILVMHVDSNAYENFKIKIDPLKPLSRLGGLSYGKTREVFDLPRPEI